MINLIPPGTKRSLRIEYWVRVLSVWSILWSIALVVGIGILYPAYILISSQVSAYGDFAKMASQEAATIQNVSTSLVQASLQAKEIVDNSAMPVFSEYIKSFESLQGTGIKLNKIGLKRNDSGVEPVSLMGMADSRQSLASFRDRLLAEKFVTSVDLPISNLARDKDIQFTILVTLNNKKDEI